MEKGIGFAGNILYVDLGSGKVWKEPLNVTDARSVVGGWGMNALLAYRHLRPGIDPYSPESPIVFGAGVLGGTLAPCADKVFATYRCPATGTVGTAVGSTRLSAMMKWAGYDHVIVSGKAEKPVYLKIADDDVEICDAASLWGLDIAEATDALNRRNGGQAVVVCIGPAGENLVNIAMALINKCSTLGRTLGGVMGSKNLKAVVVHGTKGLKVAHDRRFMQTVDELTEKHRADPLRENWSRLGLFHIVPVWARAGHFIHKSGSEVYPRDAMLERFGPQIYEPRKRGTIACTSCMAGDKSVVSVEGNDSSCQSSFSLAMMAVLAFGVRCGIDNLDQALYCLDLANRYGVDALGFANLYDWAVDLSTRGIISREDTGGLDLRYGFETTVRVLEQVKRREGFGHILAQGWLGAIKAVGRDSERHAIHIKGGDPDFDPRVTFGVETLGQATNPRAAHDMPVGGLMIALGREPDFFAKIARRIGIPEEAMRRTALEPPGDNLGRFLVHYENWCTVLNSLGICFRMQSSRLYSAESCAELYSSATGYETSVKELMAAAERAFNVYKAANVREGFDRTDDRFPEKWTKEPLRFGDEEMRIMDYFKTRYISPEDFEQILDSYYDEHGWDLRRGIPTKGKLTALGLEEICADLEQAGVLSH